MTRGSTGGLAFIRPYTKYFPELAQVDFMAQFLAVKLWLPDHQEQYRRLVDLDDDSSEMRLIITGPGSLYEALFTVPANELGLSMPIRDFLFVLDYAISVPFSSCSCEQFGSFLNLTMTKHRTQLGDERFDDIAFLRTNLPHEDEADVASLAEHWSSEGHGRGVKSREVSKVVRRLGQRVSSSFLYQGAVSPSTPAPALSEVTSSSRLSAADERE